jgi:hypothetical protein
MLEQMARTLEPLGQSDMGVWIRHMMRTEAPGHWRTGGHDRLNYFRYPRLSDTFQGALNTVFTKYKPLINAALTRSLQVTQPR